MQYWWQGGLIKAWNVLSSAELLRADFNMSVWTVRQEQEALTETQRSKAGPGQAPAQPAKPKTELSRNGHWMWSCCARCEHVAVIWRFLQSLCHKNSFLLPPLDKSCWEKKGAACRLSTVTDFTSCLYQLPLYANHGQLEAVASHLPTRWTGEEIVASLTASRLSEVTWCRNTSLRAWNKHCSACSKYIFGRDEPLGSLAWCRFFVSGWGDSNRNTGWEHSSSYKSNWDSQNLHMWK